jgi:hypothetical protein
MKSNTIRKKVIFNKILYSLVSRNVLVSVPIHSSFVNFRLKMREYCSIANDAKTSHIQCNET